MMRERIERVLSPLLGLLLFCQSAIVITGGAVRLTGSGLGCPTWPRCTHGSYAPVPHQAEGQLHAWIEFGNRLLTFVLVLVSLLALIAVLYLRRKDIRRLAVGQLLGIFAQIPLGGITVLTDLNPFPVAGHFLLSIILIAAGTSLYERREAPLLSPPHPTPLDDTTSAITRAHLFLSAAVIIAGTVVTGTGPNAGDISAPRFHLALEVVAWVHGAMVIALVLLTFWLFMRAPVGSLLRKRVGIFALLTLAQGSIGFLQFYQGLPLLLVAIHLVGVTLIWIGAWRIHLSTK